MAKSPEELRNDMIHNLPAKTGKGLAEWQALIRAAGLSRHGAVVTFLKGEHGVPHAYANQIALRSLQPAEAEVDLLGAQYAGAKAGLRPLYDRLVAAVSKFGSDVEFSPKKAYVSLRRSKQFGLVQPSTGSRLDVGLVLKGVEPGGRLEAAGSFNAMVTHRVRVAGPGDLDAELLGWLRAAYDAA